MYEGRLQSADQDPAAALAEFLGPDGNPESFWNAVKVNLQAGRIRLVFVADDIPPELRRVVEFLNNQMDPAEVLAVEVRQYVGGNFRGLVPRVLGQTEQGNRKKNAAPMVDGGYARTIRGAQHTTRQRIAGQRARVRESFTASYSYGASNLAKRRASTLRPCARLRTR